MFGTILVKLDCLTFQSLPSKFDSSIGFILSLIVKNIRESNRLILKFYSSVDALNACMSYVPLKNRCQMGLNM